MLCITVELSNLRIGQNWPNPGLAKYSGTRDRVLKIETCRLLLLLSKGCHDKPNHDLNLMIFVAMVKHQPYFPLLQSAKFCARDFSKISSHSQCFQEPRSHKKGVTHQGPDTTVPWWWLWKKFLREISMKVGCERKKGGRKVCTWAIFKKPLPLVLHKTM